MRRRCTKDRTRFAFRRRTLTHTLARAGLFPTGRKDRNADNA